MLGVVENKEVEGPNKSLGGKHIGNLRKQATIFLILCKNNRRGGPVKLESLSESFLFQKIELN